MIKKINESKEQSKLQAKFNCPSCGTRVQMSEGVEYCPECDAKLHMKILGEGLQVSVMNEKC